ncbi:MAG: hypothetical protein R3E79_49640 [Caldilineaceae bacterium]
MMSGNGTSTSTFKRWQTPALILGLVGLVLALVGAFLNQPQFWQSYLLAYLFWLEVGLGCLGLLMLHHLVGGRWSGLIRRLLETGAMTLPLLALLFIPLVIGMNTLYPWLNAAHVQQSELLQLKTGWLNAPFFLGRSAFYFLVWLVLALLFNRWSLAQDRAQGTAEAAKFTTRMRRLSAAGMILYMLTATFAGYDWLMSLEPEWFSSIYGLLWIVGQALAALSLAIIGLGMVARERGTTQAWVKSFNDLGNFLLGFVMIWAYVTYSQFLVIWSADIPEEGIWYYHRTQGGWQTVALVLIAVHFVLPFVLLLSRSLKRSVPWLTAVALLVFLARGVDLIWLIVPAFYPVGVHVHWLDLALWLAIGGGWVMFFTRQWSGKAALPIHDPHVGDSHEAHEEFTPTEQTA